MTYNVDFINGHWKIVQAGEEGDYTSWKAAYKVLRECEVEQYQIRREREG
jgi:hypothetical protein